MGSRDRDLRGAVGWCCLSVAWAALAGATALIAGFAAGIVALVGFGADSITDGVASGVLIWRFSRERADGGDDERVERRAALAVGLVLLIIGVYVFVAAVLALAGHSRPDGSAAGVALTAASLLVLPVLARAKLQLAAALGSSALRGDGILSLAGALLAGITLAGLALQGILGWWWSDDVAALLIAGFLLREGGRTASGSPHAGS